MDAQPSRQLISCRGGGCLEDVAIIATADGTRWLVPRGTGLNIHSANTGDIVATLGHHRERVTAVARDPQNPNQVYTSSLDGTIKLWDVNDGDVTDICDVGVPVYSLVVLQLPSFLYLTCGGKDADTSEIRRLDLTQKKMTNDVFKVSGTPHLEASASGDFLATVHRHTLLIWRKEQSLQKNLSLHHTKKLMCCALDPTGDKVAAGDATGRILIWHGIEQSMMQGKLIDSCTTLTTFHWHSSPVNCLSFSMDGSYLLSGGAEAVLVMWQLRSGVRQYMPRLGAAIRSISCTADPASFLVTQADNTIRLFNMSTMKVELSLYGILPPQAGNHGKSVMQPATGYLVLPASNASLQFYDAVHNKHVSILQVSRRNPVVWTNVRDVDGFGRSSTTPVEPQVLFVAFSFDASWMVTLEAHQFTGHGKSREFFLKFWEKGGGAGGQYDVNQAYVVNTHVNSPHNADATCMEYHPLKDMVVTGSSDGQFKVWVGQHNGGTPSVSTVCGWRCRSSSFLMPQELATSGIDGSLAVGAAAFSSDGSAMALSCGRSASIWDPDSNTLVSAVPSPCGPSSSHVSSFAFLSGTCSLVAAFTPPEASLVVWNLVSMSISWSYKLNVSNLAADPLSRHFAVTVTSLCSSDSPESCSGVPHVLLFDGQSCCPVGAWIIRKGNASALLFAPAGSEFAAKNLVASGTSPLMYLSDDRQYAVLNSTSQQAQPRLDSDSQARQDPSSDGDTALSAVFGRTKTKADPIAAQASGFAVENWTKHFDNSSHMLPLVSELCPSVLSSMLWGGLQSV